MRPITIAIASINTRRFTELAIRTAARYAGCDTRIVVGDSGSSDGTLPMLDRLRPRLVQHVEVAPSGRMHAEWLDHWTNTLDGEFVAFVDSDMEFLHKGWLDALLEKQRAEGAAMVAAEWVYELPFYVEPVGKTTIRLLGRPSPWLMLVHLPSVRALRCSFAYHPEPTTEYPEGTCAYDVGGFVAAEAARQGMRVSVMPEDFPKWYRHYRGKSWAPQGRRARATDWLVRARLARVRLLQSLQKRTRIRGAP